MSTAGWVWIGIAALALSALFSALFHSLRDLSRAGLESLAERKGRPGGVRRVEKILEDTDGHAAAVALPRIACNMLVAISAVFVVMYMREDSATPTAEAPTPVEIVIGLVVSSLLIWLLALVIPHSVSKHAAEGTVYVWSPLVRACYVAMRPFRKVVDFSDEVVRRLTGQDEETEGEALEAELMSVVEEAEEEGQFDQSERHMIEAVVGFRSTTVEQIMTPRTEIEAMELSNDLGKVVGIIKEVKHSRIPVYEERLDQIVGIFYVKDLMLWLAGDGARGSGKPFELRSILRPAIFVPETKTVRELLSELLARQVHIAMVVDEYGGISGLATMEDIVEEVFGDIRDEYERPGEGATEIVVLPEEKAAEIDARVYIDDANDKLRVLGVELPEGEDYDTVGGLVVTTLGRIPEAGESLRVDGVLITVLEAAPVRVERVRLEIREPESPAAPVEPGGAGAAAGAADAV